MMKKKMIIISSIIIISMLLAILINIFNTSYNENDLASISYKEGLLESEYTLYIEEDSMDIPYLVLTNNYNGNCLLMRKNLLDENIKFNPNRPGAAYYANSTVDSYLMDEFSKKFKSNLLNKVVNTEIEITTKDSLYTGNPKKEKIDRKFFLLSHEEVFGNGSSTIAREGKSIKYFEEKDHRIATHENGEKDIWWLRTPDTWYDTLVIVVSMNGGIGDSGIAGPDGECENSIRPVFCLPKDTKIKRINDKIYLDFDK